MLIQSTNNTAIFSIDAKRMLYSLLVGFKDDDEVKVLVDNLKKAQKKIVADYMLADTSNLRMLKKSDMDTITNEIFPIIRQIGIKKVAVLNSSKSCGQACILKMLEHVEVAEVKRFDTIRVAEQWLLSGKNL